MKQVHVSFQTKGKMLQESHIPHKFLKISLFDDIFEDGVVVIFLVSLYLPLNFLQFILFS